MLTCGGACAAGGIEGEWMGDCRDAARYVMGLRVLVDSELSVDFG